MSRLIVLLALAFAPLLAAAHEGHHAPRPEAAARKPIADTNGAIVAVASAPSRCPGGDHELCCCHDATFTPSFQPAAIASAERIDAALAPASPNRVQQVTSAPRTVALAGYSPRGPPTSS